MRRAINASLLIAFVSIAWHSAPVDGHTVEITSGAHTGTCIGIAMPVAEGIEGDATKVETAVRDLFTTNLSGPSVKVAAPAARLRAPAIEEARKAECGHVLLTTIRLSAGGGGGGRLLGKVAEGAGRSAAWDIPGSGIAAGAARGAALSGVDAVIWLASSTKAKDEITIEYQLVSNAGAAVGKPQTERAKAQRDGEDLVTPLVRRASEQIHAAITTR